jgi:ABC-2 type transport system ATP-binding protein
MEKKNPVILKVDALNKNFGTVTAVKDLSLEIRQGEIYALIGPNGAGKTTTIKMITGLLPPDSGRVEVMGLDLWHEDEGVKAKRLFGYVPDEPYIYNYLPAREFLELVGDLHGLTRNNTNQRIEELVAMYDLEGLIDGFFSDFSRGNKQKTTIIAALLHRPKLLIIDEPIVGLDTKSQKITQELLKKFAKLGGAVLLCTHTLPVAQAIASRIGVLNEGNLVAEGTISELRLKAKAKHKDLEEIYLKLT